MDKSIDCETQVLERSTEKHVQALRLMELLVLANTAATMCINLKTLQLQWIGR